MLIEGHAQNVQSKLYPEITTTLRTLKYVIRAHSFAFNIVATVVFVGHALSATLDRRKCVQYVGNSIFIVAYCTFWTGFKMTDWKCDTIEMEESAICVHVQLFEGFRVAYHNTVLLEMCSR